jgi:hypothetical protein
MGERANLDYFFILVLGPIIYGWSTGIPLLVLTICGFSTIIFKTRALINIFVALPLSFLFYELARPKEGWIVLDWEFSLVLAINTAWNVQLLIWLIQKAVKAFQNQKERGK